MSIWTHYSQDIQYLGDVYATPSGHEGPAFKIGSGVSTEQINNAADALDVQVVGGIARVSLSFIWAILSHRKIIL